MLPEKKSGYAPGGWGGVPKDMYLSADSRPPAMWGRGAESFFFLFFFRNPETPKTGQIKYSGKRKKSPRTGNHVGGGNPHRDINARRPKSAVSDWRFGVRLVITSASTQVPIVSRFFLGIPLKRSGIHDT